MGSIFRNIDDFAPHYPVLASVGWDRLGHSVQDEEQMVLRNVVLGATLHDALTDAYEASIATPTPTPLPAAMSRLLELSRSAIAPLSAHRAMRHLNGLFTSTGLKVTKTDDMDNAAMWQADKMSDAALEQGHDRLDMLIHYLVDHESDHPQWAGSPMRKDVRGSFITTMTTVDRHTRLLANAWVLYHLRPSMREVQTSMVAAHMPKATYDALLAKVHGASPSFTDEEEAILDLIRTAMIHGAMAEDAVSLALKKNHRGLYTIEGSNGVKSRRELPANNDQVNALARKCQRRCEDALSALRRLTEPPTATTHEPFGASGGSFTG